MDRFAGHRGFRISNFPATPAPQNIRGVQVLTLCGSLRKNSSNRATLQAFAQLAPAHVRCSSFDAIAALPHFNPDDDHDPVAPAVTALRQAIDAADCLVISTPEYAHALPGAFKNLLDWLVSDPAVAGKPVIILHIARGSEFALNSLREVLATMSLPVLATVHLPLGGNQVSPADILARAELKRALLEAVTTLSSVRSAAADGD